MYYDASSYSWIENTLKPSIEITMLSSDTSLSNILCRQCSNIKNISEYCVKDKGSPIQHHHSCKTRYSPSVGSETTRSGLTSTEEEISTSTDYDNGNTTSFDHKETLFVSEFLSSSDTLPISLKIPHVMQNNTSCNEHFQLSSKSSNYAATAERDSIIKLEELDREGFEKFSDTAAFENYFNWPGSTEVIEKHERTEKKIEQHQYNSDKPCSFQYPLQTFLTTEHQYNNTFQKWIWPSNEEPVKIACLLAISYHHLANPLKLNQVFLDSSYHSCNSEENVSYPMQIIQKKHLAQTELHQHYYKNEKAPTNDVDDLLCHKTQSNDLSLKEWKKLSESFRSFAKCSKPRNVIALDHPNEKKSGVEIQSVKNLLTWATATTFFGIPILLAAYIVSECELSTALFDQFLA